MTPIIFTLLFISLFGTGLCVQTYFEFREMRVFLDGLSKPSPSFYIEEIADQVERHGLKEVRKLPSGETILELKVLEKVEELELVE